MPKGARDEMPSDKIRVLFVTASLTLGGIERFVRNLSVSLLESGAFEPSICCLMRRSGPFLDDVTAKDIPVYECRVDAPHFLGFAWRFCKLLKRIRPDIVHSQANWSVPWQVLGAKLAGVPSLFFTERSTYFRKGMSRLRAIAYDRLTSKFIDIRSAIAGGVRDHLAKKLLRRPDSILVTHNGVDLEAFRFRPELKRRQKQALGIGADSPIVGMVASLRAVKGHRFLIDAAPAILAKKPDCRFMIVGDGHLRATLAKHATELGIERSFIFLGNRTGVQDLYAAMDVMALPSLREGFPNVLVEAQASGVPVVASDVGGAGEILNYGKAGLLVPPGDVAALADAILRILGDQDLSGQLRSRGLEQADKFSLENCVARYRQLYEELVDRKGTHKKTLSS